MTAITDLIDFAFVLQSLASITTIVGMWLYGSKSLWGPRVGLMGQVFWWSIMVQSSLWGLLPVNIAMFVIHGRTYLKWRKRLKNEDVFDLPPMHTLGGYDKPESVLGTQVGGSHYTDCKIQPITYVWANNLGFSEGSVVKYITRWRSKGGIKDLEKAKHHIALMIEHEQKTNGL